MAAWVGDNWGQLWEENRVLRDKEELKRGRWPCYPESNKARAEHS